MGWRVCLSIARGAIRPLRGRWLAEHFAEGGALRRRRELPPEAFWTEKDVPQLRGLALALGDGWGWLFVALSYRAPPPARFEPFTLVPSVRMVSAGPTRRTSVQFSSVH